jgi:broad specificity phosphatase PhoE
MRLILVRHGETDWNRAGRFQGQTDEGLNEKGLKQAQEVAAALLPLRPIALYTSPLPRALETAQVISRLTALPVKTLEGLREAHLGELEGITGEELRTRYPDFFRRWREDPSSVTMPGGESLAQLQERAWGATLAIARAHSDGPAVVVTHNFAIRAILCRLLGLPLSQFRRLRVDLGSITVIELDGEGGQLITLNDRCHLSRDEAGG